MADFVWKVFQCAHRNVRFRWICWRSIRFTVIGNNYLDVSFRAQSSCVHKAKAMRYTLSIDEKTSFNIVQSIKNNVATRCPEIIIKRAIFFIAYTACVSFNVTIWQKPHHCRPCSSTFEFANVMISKEKLSTKVWLLDGVHVCND